MCDGFGYVTIENNKVKVVYNRTSSGKDEFTFYDNPNIVSAVKLQKLMKKWEHDLVTAPLNEQPENWKDHEVSDYVSKLILESEKN